MSLKSLREDIDYLLREKYPDISEDSWLKFKANYLKAILLKSGLNPDLRKEKNLIHCLNHLKQIKGN